MPRIQPIDRSSPPPDAAPLVHTVEKRFGTVPNMLATLARAPAALDGYLAFSGALSGATLSARLREQVALTVGEANGCDYCLAAHSLIGKSAGLREDEILDSRTARSGDPKTSAILALARTIVDQRGKVEDADVEEARAAGVSDAEIIEVVALVALNIFTNYFNHLADPELDFPKVPLHADA